MISASPVDVSVVTAVYNVARYLPDFFASIEGQQGVDLSRIEIVAVDDGSTDASLADLHRYQEEFALRGILPMTVLTKPNGGQGSARNLGIEHARGTWVTFTDPDDTLAPDYLAKVLGFIAANPQVEMIATNRVFHDDATGEISDTHALRQMFVDGDRLADLERSPELFHGSAPAAFVRRERVLADTVRFDDRIRPNFEDGHFCTHYLLACPRPLVGFLASAIYYYRKRADGSSTLQNSVVRPERYTVVPRLGYLDVLRYGLERFGHTPEWVQNFVLYDLSWYFGAENSPGGSATAAVGDVADEFLGCLREIREYLDAQVIESFRARWIDPAWRQILLHGLSARPWHSTSAVLSDVDETLNLVKVVHRFVGAEPPVEYVSGGLPIEPSHTKLRAHVYFDHALLWERISWLPADAPLRVRVEGRLLELRRNWHGATLTSANPVPKRPEAKESLLHIAVKEPDRVLGSANRRAFRKLAKSPLVRRRYGNAWVLMDRIHDADDSAEHLFVYLRENRPQVNAWFTVEAGTPDYVRLKAGRHGDRVVAHGSTQWKLLMLNCKHLISSHIDVPVHRPPAIKDLLFPKQPSWRFTFLQHGVIKDDLSRWLNSKPLDLFVTSTVGEYESIAGDGNAYMFTSKEVKLTGLPRFDKLRRVSASLSPQERNLVLVAPTWRHWLMPPLEKGSQRRTVREDFLDTDYAVAWLGVLRSPQLAAIAEKHDLRIGFLPHPNLQSILPRLDLPPYVERLTFEGANVQRLFASAAVLVTDYSSMAFNSAYVDRPVVYYQFDADLVSSGAHVGRAGYFDYRRDGFGPVTQTTEETVAQIADIADRGCTPAPEYADRIARTFPQRDGRCCERVVAEIEKLDRRAPRRSSTLTPAHGLPVVAPGRRGSARDGEDQVPDPGNHVPDPVDEVTDPGSGADPDGAAAATSQPPGGHRAEADRSLDGMEASTDAAQEPSMEESAEVGEAARTA